MNKQELIAHFQEQKKVAEREIAFWQAQPDEENAEKPKLGHGDFGLDDEPYVIVSQKTLPGSPKAIFASTGGLINADESMSSDTRLGNIFKMMEGWDEEFKEFTFDVHRIEINTVDFAHAPIHIAGNWHTSDEAYEIWLKLGHTLAEPKKKQGD